MDRKNHFSDPPIIDELLDQLYDLVQNQSKDGRLKAVQVANFLGMNTDALRHCIQAGCVPFAFANGKSGRAESYIPVLPFYSWVTQRNFGITSLRMQGSEEESA